MPKTVKPGLVNFAASNAGFFYLDGVRLAWLIDPYEEKVYIYRENGENETFNGFAGKKLSGETVMPEMELPLELLR